MKCVIALALLALCGLSQAQRNQLPQPTTTPVPILRQVNKVNDDGSYTYGYENADGSYKIETKNTQGQVQGKYGYYDNEGTLREVEYGAKTGFYPQGTDIRAVDSAPPSDDPNAPTDGSYDRNLYELPYAYNNQLAQQSSPVAPQAPVRRVKAGRRQNAARQFAGFQQTQPQPQYQQQQQQQQYQQPQPQQYQQPANDYQQQQQNYLQQQQQYQQQQQQYIQQQQQYQHYQNQAQPSAFNQASHFLGHPARNIDLNTGSYSVNYSG